MGRGYLAPWWEFFLCSWQRGFPSPASEERWPACYKEGVFCNLYDGVMQTEEIENISTVGQVAEMHESVDAKSLNGRSLGL